MKEIRLHGRGGQGAVTAAQLLAAAAFEERKFVQSFASFGMERRGAPVIAFTRIDEKPIETRGMVQNPGYLILLDPSVLNFPNTFTGLKPGGVVLINSTRSAFEIMKEMRSLDGKVFTLDATQISVTLFGQTSIPFTNVIMVSAFSKVTGMVKIESIIKVLPDFFSPKTLKKNRRAAKLGYEGMKEILTRSRR